MGKVVKWCYSYINENNEKVYYTYRQYFTKQNYVISDDCVSILYIGSNAYIAYKADGTKVIIYNTEGYDVMGYDREGYDKEGYNREGYDRNGYDREGYNRSGYDKEGYDRNGHDVYGCCRDGYNEEGYDRYGCRRDGYNDEGYDKDGYDRNGYDKDGYDRNGYNKDGYDEDGRNKFGVKEVLVQAHDKNGAAGTELFFALEYGIGTCFGGQKGEAFFFDKNGKLYKKCSNVEFIVSSKPFGKGKVYYRRNRKTKKPSRYNPKGNKYRDGNKYSTYFNMSKSIKKGRHVTYRFYKKIKGEKCYMYSYTSNVAK